MKTPFFGLARPSLLMISGLSMFCQSVEAKPTAPRGDIPEPSEHHYGVYLNEAKVGWMRVSVEVGEQVRFGVELHAAVGGMGTVSKVQLSEMRSYRAKGGELLELAFTQSAATGAVKVHGVRRGNILRLETSAGGAIQKQEYSVHETLSDALVVERLARNPRVGATASSTRFDPSIQKTLQIEHKVMAVEDRFFGGVAVKAVRVESRYADLNVTESSWLDDKGKVLESRVGGFFVARLEPADVAKKLDYSQDLLMNAVVRTPKVLPESASVSRLRVRFAGFGKEVPPASPRQKVRVVGKEVVIDLSRDAPPKKTSLPVVLGPRDGDMHKYLAPTAFIQSEAPEVKKAARSAVGDTKDVFVAIERLVVFVYAHVRDEYVPAYSNALEALASGRGDCTEHSVLFVALARALGIPARVTVGIAYWPPGKGFGWHAWAEVFVEGRWIHVDPTWNQPIADATHVKLADGGPAEQARIVMLLGQLKVSSLEVL